MSTHDEPTGPRLHGIAAEFPGVDALAEATKKAVDAGWKRLDAYTPYGDDAVCNALGVKRTEISTVMLLGGLVGGTCGFMMLTWTNAISYPINVGGRPYLSWPAFIPITFELTVLTTALSGVFGLFALCGLPRFHHPVFNSELVAGTSRDKFVLVLEAADPKFDPAGTRSYLESLGATAVEEVPL